MTASKNCRTSNSRGIGRAQRGIAALELAAALIPLILLLLGIATFGALFHTQHVLTRAAEDGARVVSMYTGADEPMLKARVQEAVNESLGAYLRAFTNAPEVTGTNPVFVVIRMNYKSNPLLSHLPWADEWLPEMLQGRAAAASSL